MSYDYSILIPCLFCNNYIHYDICKTCHIKYNFLREYLPGLPQKRIMSGDFGRLYIYSFYVTILTPVNEFEIYYNLRKLTCAILSPWGTPTGDKILVDNIPMDKFLIPIHELKDKVNNMLGYL